MQLGEKASAAAPRPLPTPPAGVGVRATEARRTGGAANGMPLKTVMTAFRPATARDEGRMPFLTGFWARRSWRAPEIPRRSPPASFDASRYANRRRASTDNTDGPANCGGTHRGEAESGGPCRSVETRGGP